MPTRAVVIALLAVVALGGQVLSACGDKFLILNRGTRFQRAERARTPAAVLIYENPSSALSSALAGISVDATLTDSGYRPVVVRTAQDWNRALERGGWDLVILDIADAAAVPVAGPAGASAALLPIAYKLDGSLLEQAKKQRALVLKGPVKRQAFLDAIDDALARRVVKPAGVRKIS